MSVSGFLPIWKIKREWERLKQQAGQWHWFMFGWFRKLTYDQRRNQVVRVIDGQHPAANDYAVVLIYQPKGILKSLLAELQHLSRNGFAPVVVSNLALSAEDEALLKPLCNLIVERPNFGYDFGGYREGVLCLLDRNRHIENLIVKNDSVWFPLFDDCDFLNGVRESKADIYGIYMNEYQRRPERSHVQSYFYRFSPRLVESPAFRDYWKKLWLTDNKHMVIRQCEMKLTNHFLRKGFSADTLYRQRDLQNALKALPDDQLVEVLRYTAQVETRAESILRPLLGDYRAPQWRVLAEQLIDRGQIGSYLMIAHPLALLRQLKCPVLKKDRQLIYQIQRAELSRSGVLGQLNTSVRTEIAEWDPV